MRRSKIVQPHYDRGELIDAMAVVKQMEGSLGEHRAPDERTRASGNARTNLEMVARLQEIRMEMSSCVDDAFDYEGADLRYALAFQEYGIDVANLDADDAGLRIRSQPIALELATALDMWVDVCKSTPEQRRWPLETSAGGCFCSADPDEWRNRFR